MIQASSSNWQSGGLQNRMLWVRVLPGLPSSPYTMSQANDPLKERVVFCSSDGLCIDVKTEAVKVFGYGCVSKKHVLLGHSQAAFQKARSIGSFAACSTRGCEAPEFGGYKVKAWVMGRKIVLF